MSDIFGYVVLKQCAQIVAFIVPMSSCIMSTSMKQPVWQRDSVRVSSTLLAGFALGWHFGACLKCEELQPKETNAEPSRIVESS